MNRLVATLCLAVCLAAPIAQAARADQAAIRGVIGGQIDAFLAGDYATAFTYASPTIKRLFGTPERFGAMVRDGYPMVHRPRSVEYLELRTVAGSLWQRVMMTDADGRIHFLDYQMVETPEGWQINAVQILRGAGLGA